MNLIIYRIPNMNRFLDSISKCSGRVLLEKSDRHYFDLKDDREAALLPFFADRNQNGVRLLFESNDDAIMLFRTLLAS